jgi:hypothetical protein
MSEEEITLWLYVDTEDDNIPVENAIRYRDSLDFYMALAIAAEEVFLIIVDSGEAAEFTVNSIQVINLTLEDLRRRSILTLPRSIFKDEGTVRGWADDFFTSFAPNLQRALRREAASHLRALARIRLERRGVPGHVGKQIFDDYLSDVGERMRNFLSLVGPHGQMPGNKKTLTILARQALRTARKFKLLRDYYEHINLYLRQNHPRLASNSGEALRKRFGRLGIDLKALISESDEFRKQKVLISKKLGTLVNEPDGGRL